MDVKIRKLQKTYTKEIRTIFNELVEERYPGIKPQSLSKFGNEIAYFYNITDFQEYDKYVEMLNKVEEYNPKLAENLEEYLEKELNLVALLSLHAAVNKLKLS